MSLFLFQSKDQKPIVKLYIYFLRRDKILTKKHKLKLVYAIVCTVAFFHKKLTLKFI